MTKTKTKTPSKILPRSGGVGTHPITPEAEKAAEVVAIEANNTAAEDAALQSAKSATTKHGFALVRAAASDGVDGVERVLLSFQSGVRAKACKIATKLAVSLKGDVSVFTDALAKMPAKEPRAPKVRDTATIWISKKDNKTARAHIPVEFLNPKRGDLVRFAFVDGDTRSVVITLVSKGA